MSAAKYLILALCWFFVFFLLIHELTQAQPTLSGIEDPTAVLPIQPLPFPALNTAVFDPVFGTSLRRVTDRRQNGDFGTQTYSQLQAISPDNRYILLIEDGGYLVRHFDTLALQPLPTGNWNTIRWHPTEPHTLVHFDGNDNNVLVFQQTNVETGQTETLFTFPTAYRTIIGSRSYEEMSRDGRWLAGYAQLVDGSRSIFTLDLENGRFGAELPLDMLYSTDCAPDPDWGNVEMDWVGVSPLGNYLVVQWVRDGTARCSGTETYDIATGAYVGHVNDRHDHSDLGVDTDGSEFLMTFAVESPSGSGNPSIVKRALPGPATGVAPKTYLTEIDWGQAGAHISCQGVAGVCVVSTGKSLATDNWRQH
ncbi:MAG: hypothetical protein AAF614_42065 [Chloroflexota bacterium]